MYGNAACSINPTEASYESSSFMKPKIRVHYEISRQRDCNGFGFCVIDLYFTIREGKKGNGLLYTDDASRNTLILEINKSTDITAESYEKYFKSGIFLMEDDCPLPLELSKSLELAGQKIIRSGNHRIVENNGILYVYLPLK